MTYFDDCFLGVLLSLEKTLSGGGRDTPSSSKVVFGLNNIKYQMKIASCR
jgi:hypothetical protein